MWIIISFLYDIQCICPLFSSSFNIVNQRLQACDPPPTRILSPDVGFSKMELCGSRCKIPLCEIQFLPLFFWCCGKIIISLKAVEEKRRKTILEPPVSSSYFLSFLQQINCFKSLSVLVILQSAIGNQHGFILKDCK